jgi:hypothetical protein
MTHWADELNDFIGNENYYPIMPDIYITDGTKFVADKGKADWLMTTIASYLPALTTKEFFIIARLTVTRTESSCTALLILDDDIGNILAEQFIEHTDFELDHIKLYVYYAYDKDKWVILLPCEY